MNLIFLSAVASIGGAETSLLGLVTGLRRILPRGRLQLIAGEDGPLLERARRLGISARIVALGQLRALGDSQLGRPGGARVISGLRTISSCLSAMPDFIDYAGRLRRAIAEVQPDIVHSNGMKTHLVSALSTPAGVPLIWQMHDYVGSRALMKRLLRGAMLRRPVLVGVSRSVMADIRSSLRCAPERTSYIYNSVDPDIFTVNGPRADLDRIAGMAPAPAGTIKIGLVGTFARWKGHKVFLSALAAVPREIQFRAYIVGAPVYATPNSQYSLEELKETCRMIGISDRVAFTGFCQQTPEVYRALDIVVHASVAPEPFGMVLAEAMSTGKPIITTACGGAAELCSDAENCLVCHPGDAASMSRAIVALCLNPELRRKLADCALAKASQWLHPERTAAEMLRVYRHAADLKHGKAQWVRTQFPEDGLMQPQGDNPLLHRVSQERRS